MSKKSEDRFDTYDELAFGKRVAAIKANPSLLDTKEKLVEFWQLALEERGRNKHWQADVAFIAARTVGTVHFEHIEGDPYQDIILQFAHMDHMGYWGYWRKEADKEWDKLADMLHKLPENRQEK